jgi:glycosyltransferase involved in cell wall biosynthesis
VRVALICPEFPPNSIGGGGEVFSALSRHLPALGIQLDVISGNYRGGARDWSEGGVRYSEIPLMPTPAATPYLRTVLPPTRAGRRRLRALIASGSYDLAHLHGISFPTVDIAAHLLHKHRIPWVFTLHGAPRMPYRLPAPIRAAYAAYLHYYGSLAISGAAVRTAVSRAAVHFPPIAPWMGDARIIPHGVELEQFAAGTAEREIAGWPMRARNVILSIGRIDYAKGFDVGIRALAALPTDTAYVVLGDDLGELRRLRGLAERLGVSERFLTLGHATLEQRRFAMRRSALVWVPSRYESFGIVALEAMAAGLPVIASGVEGLRDIFTGENVELLLASPDDAAGLASKSEALLADDAERRRVGERLRARAEDFNWNAIAQQYVECYRTANGIL